MNSDPRAVQVRVSTNMSLGQVMSTIRTWLDDQKIQPLDFKTAVDATGVILSTRFRRDDEAELFRQRFDPKTDAPLARPVEALGD
jgi:hypothetical protein